MNKIQFKFFIILFLLFSTIAWANFKGIEKKQSSGSRIGLEKIPAQIGDWKMVNDQDNRQKLSEWEFMNEMILRAYARPDGKIVRLAVVYGADQRQAFAVHLPEGCYRAAGFEVENIGDSDVIGNGVALKRLIARGQGMTEPISYWVMLDGLVVTNHLERKFKQLYYTIFEKPAYGALIRVTSPSMEENTGENYEAQADFIRQMSKALPTDLKKTLFGNMVKL